MNSLNYEEDNRNNSNTINTIIKEVMYKGELVECMKDSDGSYKVLRLISTSPNAFLKKCYMPGATLDAKYINKVNTNQSNYNNIFNTKF